MKSNLTRYFEFQKRLESTRSTAAARAKARIDLAENFRNIKLGHLKDDSQESYFVLLKLGLAFTAVEAVEGVLGKGNRIVITDDAFRSAVQQGTFNKLVEHLYTQADRTVKRRDKSRSDEELPPFMNGSCPSDLAVLVRHSRNVVFHASMTPSTIGLAGAPVSRRLLLGLANQAIRAAEKTLEDWAAKQLAQLNL